MAKENTIKIKDSNTIASKIGMVIIYIILIGFAVLCIYPLIWLFLNSFKTSQEFQLGNKLGFPKNWVFINYADAWVKGNFPTLIMNSVFYTLVTTASVVFLSFMSGFAFAKIRCKATTGLYGGYVIGVLMTINSILIPLFIMLFQVGLYDSRLGVLLPYIGIGMPMSTYLATEYIKSIPTALVESARIDGAKYFRIFFSIIFPMARPVAVTQAILSITGTWNEFVLVNILTQSAGLKSLPVGVNSFAGTLNTDYGKMFAALVIGLIPMLVFYLVFRKEITKGVAAGAVKG